MKNDLTCGVVEDLLPSYAEGLTSPETNGAVERHLSGCEACSAKLAAMRSPEPEQEREETAKEVDYLKKVKRRGWKRVALAVVLTVLVLVGALAAKVFVIGWPGEADHISDPTTSVEDDTLQVRFYCLYASHTFYGWEQAQEDGVVTFTAREVRSSLLHPYEFVTLSVPLEGTREVWVCGRLIWQEGTAISNTVSMLFDRQAPYVGDASAVGNLLGEIDHWYGPIGPYTISLQTAAEPYGMTVMLKNPLPGGGDAMVERYSALLLALVKNLGEVTWTYPDPQGNPCARTVTCTDAEGLLAESAQERGLASNLQESIKAYALSPSALQKLRDLL